MSVSVQYEVKSDQLPKEADCIAWAQAAQLDSNVEIELNIRIVSKAEIQALNQLYRGKNNATNVLSFSSELPLGTDAAIHKLADVVICAEIVAAEAEEFNKPLLARWSHMVVHGTLHVQGFDHENEDDRLVMEAEERKILAELQFSDPYAN